MSSQMTSELTEIIQSGQNCDDLLPFLQHIPLQTLKTMINSHLSTIKENKSAINTMYNSCRSIGDIIPSTNLQSILSYLPYQKSLKSVNQMFQHLIEMNVSLKRKERGEYVSSQFQGPNEWIVDPLRDTLTNNESAKGIKGPFKTLGEVLKSEEFESGDTVYLAEGTHQTKHFTNHKDANVVGIGNCRLEYIFYEKCPEAEFRVIFVGTNQKVAFTNIQMHCDRIAINVEDKGALYLTDCTFTEFEGIQIEKRSLLDCTGCAFSNHKVSLSAISANQHPCTLRVVDCTFDGCGGYQLDPTIKFSMDTTPEDLNESQLVIIGNTFLNQNQTPASRPIGDDLSTKSKLPQNAVVRYNQIEDGAGDVLELFVDKGRTSEAIQDGDRRKCHLRSWSMHEANEKRKRQDDQGSEDEDSDDEQDSEGAGNGDDASGSGHCGSGCGCC